MDTCLLCLEELNIPYAEPACSCKVKLHTECLKQIVDHGLICPICRIRSTRSNVQNELRQNNIILMPHKIMGDNPTIFTFCIAILWSFIVFIFYIIPQMIFLLIKVNLDL